MMDWSQGHARPVLAACLALGAIGTGWGQSDEPKRVCLTQLDIRRLQKKPLGAEWAAAEIQDGHSALSLEHNQSTECHTALLSIEHDEEITVPHDPIVIGRLRFPGTASSHEQELFTRYEEGMERFSDLTVKGGRCPGSSGKGDESEPLHLCFSFHNSTSGSGSDVVAMALRKVQQASFGAHSAYDVVERSLTEAAARYQQVHHFTEPLIMTNLREVGSYASKWYAFRRVWDAEAPGLVDATFEEWLDLAPWRQNVLTRMLGAQPDRKSMPSGLVYTKAGMEGFGSLSLDEFMADEYMLQQNLIGPSESEGLSLALERLRGMVHFGLFHRLKDSWKLMEHTFCWNIGYQSYRPDKEISGFAAFKRLVSDDPALWERVQEKNKLDVALMEEAERIFEDRLEKMKREKADNVICNFMGKVEVRCANGCGAMNEKL